MEPFRSFTFNSVNISDLGFSVSSEGSRNSRFLQPDFSNSLTSVPGMKGSIFWGTEITGQTKDIPVVTEGATSRQVASLEQLLVPGSYAKLSFSESDYKYTYALINQKSDFTFVPFPTITKIDGVEYDDILYKGESRIYFFFPNVVYYSDYDLATPDMITKIWFLESGIPLQSWLNTIATFLPNGIRANKTTIIPESTALNLSSIQAYNAGQSNADANLCFTMSVPVSSTGTSWQNIKLERFAGDIDLAILTKPRSYRDVDFAANLLLPLKDIWDYNTKMATLDVLRENLESPLRAQIIGITNATGEGLYWPTIDDGVNAILNLVNNVNFLYSIDSTQKQTKMSGTVNGYLFTGDVTPTTLEIEENLGDSFNGNYIQILGTKGMSDNGLTFQTIRVVSGGILKDVRLYFKYTY